MCPRLSCVSFAPFCLDVRRADAVWSRTGFVPFIVAFFTKDFFLGDTHNAVEGKKVTSGSQENLITPNDQEAAGTQAVPVDDRGSSVRRRAQGN